MQKKEIIPMKYDVMFTEIFNNKKNICILEEFIADYFGYKLEDVRGNIKLEDRKLSKRRYKDNNREVDLIFKYKNESINIEISTGWDQGIIDRNVVYLSDIHSSQNYKNYWDIKPTIQINLLAFNYNNEIKTTYYLKDKKGNILTKKLEIDIISMEIGKRMCYTNNAETDKLIKWSKAFMSTSYEELNEVLKTILTKSSKEQLLSEVLRLSGDDNMKKKLEEKSKLQMEHESFLHYFEEKIEQLDNKEQQLDNKEQQLDNKEQQLDNIILNKQQEKTIEIAKKMLGEKCDMEFISNVTGLSKESILKIK